VSHEHLSNNPIFTDGNAFLITVVDTALADNGSIYVQLRTPKFSAARIYIDAHASITETAKKSGQLEILEAPAFTTGDAAVAVINVNRNTVKTSKLSNVFSNPTSIVGGTSLGKITVGVHNEELPAFWLKPETDYIIQLTNLSTAGANCGIAIHLREG